MVFVKLLLLVVVAMIKTTADAAAAVSLCATETCLNLLASAACKAVKTKIYVLVTLGILHFKPQYRGALIILETQVVNGSQVASTSSI